MDDVATNLAEERAVRAGDSSLWTPADALRALLRDIEIGAIKPDQLVVYYTELKDDGGQSLHFCVSNVERRDHVYLLNHALRIVLDESRA